MFMPDRVFTGSMREKRMVKKRKRGKSGWKTEMKFV